MMKLMQRTLSVIAFVLTLTALSAAVAKSQVASPDGRTVVAVMTRDGGKNVTTRRFEARSPAAAIEANASGAALNRAANQVAADVATWVGEAK